MYQNGPKDFWPDFQPGNNQKNIYSNPGDGNRIKFKKGTTEFLNEEEETKFEKILNGLKDGQTISLEGFASSDGDKDKNFKLSHDRVLKIERLIKKRHPNITINHSACGEVEGDLEENRAVQIMITSVPTHSFVWANGSTTPLRPPPQPLNDAFRDWPIRRVEDGYGDTERQRFTLNIRIDREDFMRLRDQYLTDPSVLNNNSLAEYFPLGERFERGERLAVGDHMYINIWGPLNGVVRFTNIEFNETRFLIEGVTLEPPSGTVGYNHPDAGIIRFMGEYDPDSGFADIEIENVTRLGNWMTYISGPSSLGLNYGRGQQKEQWRTVILNIEDFLGGDENGAKWQSIETIRENGESTLTESFEF